MRYLEKKLEHRGEFPISFQINDEGEIGTFPPVELAKVEFGDDADDKTDLVVYESENHYNYALYMDMGHGWFEKIDPE